MRNMGTIIKYCVTLITIAASTQAFAAQPQVCIKDVCVNAEIVSSAADMQKGLQGRDGLDAAQGMLFVFPDDNLHQFWMKDMKFPIDMIWLDHDRQVVFIASNVPACKADPCVLYAPHQLARYVLEVQAGFAAQHKVKNGTAVSFKDVPPEFIVTD